MHDSMRRRRGLRLLGITLLVALSVPLLQLGNTVRADDTPSLGPGDCWRSGWLKECTYNWQGRSTSVYFRAVDHFSPVYPQWRAPANQAVMAWNNAPGPQYYSFAGHTNDVWVFFNYAYSGQYGLGQYIPGISYQCDRTGYCSDTLGVAMYIYYSIIYLNASTEAAKPYNELVNVIEHEAGHTMGLGHNTTDSNSIMYLGNTVLNPDSSDWGRYPGCSRASNGVYGFGLNCIYGNGD